MNENKIRPGTELALKGTVYVCCACGKTSRTRYGFLDDGTRVAQPGWDESCMMNCALYEIKYLTYDERGHVMSINSKAKAL